MANTVINSLWSNSTTTNSRGKFELVFDSLQVGDPVSIHLSKAGYEVLLEYQLDANVRAPTDTTEITVYIVESELLARAIKEFNKSKEARLTKDYKAKLRLTTDPIERNFLFREYKNRLRREQLLSRQLAQQSFLHLSEEYAKAQSAFNNQDFSKVIEVLDPVSLENSITDAVSGMKLVAQSYEFLDSLIRAEELYSKVIIQEPDNLYNYIILAGFYWNKLQDRDKAILWYEDALSRNPDNQTIAHIYKSLGLINEDLNPVAAIDYYTKSYMMYSELEDNDYFNTDQALSSLSSVLWLGVESDSIQLVDSTFSILDNELRKAYEDKALPLESVLNAAEIYLGLGQLAHFFVNSTASEYYLHMADGFYTTLNKETNGKYDSELSDVLIVIAQNLFSDGDYTTAQRLRKVALDLLSNTDNNLEKKIFAYSSLIISYVNMDHLDSAKLYIDDLKSTFDLYTSRKDNFGDSDFLFYSVEGYLLYHNQQQAEGLRLLKKALAISENQFRESPNHSATSNYIQALHNLSSVYMNSGAYVKAISYSELAYKVIESEYKSYDMLYSQRAFQLTYNIGMAYGQLNQLSKTKSWLKVAEKNLNFLLKEKTRGLEKQALEVFTILTNTFRHIHEITQSDTVFVEGKKYLQIALAQKETAEKGNEAADLWELLEENQGYFDNNSIKKHDTSLALNKACAWGDLDIAFEILNSGQNPNILVYDSINSNQSYAIQNAVKSGNHELVRLLVDFGANPKVYTEKGLSLLHLGINENTSLKLIELLLELGVELEQQSQSETSDIQLNEYDYSALHKASEVGRLDILKLLLKSPADLGRVTSLGNTLLHMAAQSDNRELLSYLIKQGLDIYTLNDYQLPPIAYVGDNLENLDFFLENGHSLDNPLNSSGLTSIHYASIDGSNKAISHLVQKGANIEVTLSDNYQDLRNFISTFIRSENEFQPLDSTIFIRHFSKATPLTLAIISLQDSTIGTLLSKGADINLKTDLKYTPLHFAAINADTSIVKRLINHGADLNSISADGITPLIASVLSEKSEVTKLLLREGANVNLDNSFNGYQAIHFAAITGDLSLVELLLSKGANIEPEIENLDILFELLTRQGNLDHEVDIALKVNTPFALALLVGKDEIASLLLQKGADHGVVKYPMSLAAAQGLLSTIKQLHSLGYSIQDKDSFGETPLLVACGNKHYEVAKYLINEGVDIESVNDEGLRPIHFAAEYGSNKILKLLIDAGADLNAKDGFGAAAIHRAAYFGNLETLKFLVEKGADILSLGTDNMSILPTSVLSKDLRIVEYLLSLDLHSYISLKDKENAVNKAILFAKPNILQLLLNNGFPLLESMFSLPSFSLIGLKTPQRYEEKFYYLNLEQNLISEMMEILIKSGLEVNYQDSDGRSALHYSSGHSVDGGFKHAKELLSIGANVNIIDNEGNTPLHYALRANEIDIAYLLINSGADVLAINNIGISPFLISAGKGQLEMVQTFLNRGNNINQVGFDEMTGLHFATIKNDLEVIELLIRSGATIDLKDTSGDTPLSIAIQMEHLEIVAFLLKNGANTKLKNNKGFDAYDTALFQGNNKIIEMVKLHYK